MAYTLDIVLIPSIGLLFCLIAFILEKKKLLILGGGKEDIQKVLPEDDSSEGQAQDNQQVPVKS